MDPLSSLNSIEELLRAEPRNKVERKREGIRRECIEAAPQEAPGLIWAVWIVPEKEVRHLTPQEVVDILSGAPASLCPPLSPKEVADEMADAEAVPDAQSTDDDAAAKGWAWIHFNVAASSPVALEKLAGFPEEAQELLVDPENNIILEGEDGVIWGALPAFDQPNSSEDRDFSDWRFAMRADLLLTTRREPIPVLGMVFSSLTPKDAPDNPAELIDRVLRDFTMMVRRQLDRLDDGLDRAEDLVLAEHRHDHAHMATLLGKVRRRSVELRRVLSPIDRVLRDPDVELPGWAEDALRDRGEEQVHAALDDLIALQERSRSLQDELASSQTEETNRRLYMVSAATTLILPATFVTGFFGMNTSEMFFTSGHWGTIEAGIVCLISMVLTWAGLRYFRLL